MYLWVSKLKNTFDIKWVIQKDSKYFRYSFICVCGLWEISYHKKYNVLSERHQELSIVSWQCISKVLQFILFLKLVYYYSAAWQNFKPQKAPLNISFHQIKLSDFFKQLHYIQNTTQNYTNNPIAFKNWCL